MKVRNSANISKHSVLNVTKYKILFALAVGFVVILAVIFESNLIIPDGTKQLNPDEPRLEVLMVVEGDTNSYQYAFKTCAGKQSLLSPIIIISTDSDEKTIRSIRNLEPGQCYVTGTQIKAQNPSSITLSISDEPSKKLPTNDEEISKLVSQIKAKNKKMATLLAQDPTPKDFDAKFDQLITDIASLRTEIKKLQ